MIVQMCGQGGVAHASCAGVSDMCACNVLCADYVQRAAMKDWKCGLEIASAR